MHPICIPTPKIAFAIESESIKTFRLGAGKDFTAFQSIERHAEAANVIGMLRSFSAAGIDDVEQAFVG